MLVHAVSSSRLDYCNSVFLNMKKSNLYKLQKVQNAAARLVVQKRKRDSISATLKELHWLRIESRILFKLLLFVYKYTRGNSPTNLKIQYKSHNCRTGDFLMLKHTSFDTKHGKRTFDYAAPRLWNALPPDVRKAKTLQSFKSMVKTILFLDTEGFQRKAFSHS